MSNYLLTSDSILSCNDISIHIFNQNSSNCYYQLKCRLVAVIIYKELILQTCSLIFNQCPSDPLYIPIVQWDGPTGRDHPVPSSINLNKNIIIFPSFRSFCINWYKSLYKMVTPHVKCAPFLESLTLKNWTMTEIYHEQAPR